MGFACRGASDLSRRDRGGMGVLARVFPASGPFVPKAVLWWALLFFFGGEGKSEGKTLRHVFVRFLKKDPSKVGESAGRQVIAFGASYGVGTSQSHRASIACGSLKLRFWSPCVRPQIPRQLGGLVLPVAAAPSFPARAA